MYENNAQGEHDLPAARIEELKSAGWAVPLDTEAVEDGARNIRLNADKAALSVDAATAAAEAKATAALGEVTRRVGAVESTANTAKSGVEQLRGSIAAHETRIGATERANQELNGRVQALENTPAPAPSPVPVSGGRLSGSGRPDIASTLSSELAKATAVAPIGASFSSTDGAGVGAWAWQKTPAGWVVAAGDTGWRSIGSIRGIAQELMLRRMGNAVYLSPRGNRVTVNSLVANATLRLPSGFTSAARNEILITSDGRVYGRVLAKPGDSSLFATTTANVSFAGLVGASYVTDDPWPSVLPGAQ